MREGAVHEGQREVPSEHFAVSLVIFPCERECGHSPAQILDASRTSSQPADVDGMENDHICWIGPCTKLKATLETRLVKDASTPKMYRTGTF